MAGTDPVGVQADRPAAAPGVGSFVTLAAGLPVARVAAGPAGVVAEHAAHRIASSASPVTTCFHCTGPLHNVSSRPMPGSPT